MLKVFIPCLFVLFACTPSNNSNQNNQQQKQRNNFVPISTKKVVSQAVVPDTKIDFELLDGKQWFLDSNIIIFADRGENLIDLRLRFSLPDSVEIPQVYSTSFHEYHKADNLEVKVELIDSTGKVFFVETRNGNGAVDEGRTMVDFDIDAEALRHFRPGSHHFEMRISTELMTFFQRKSGMKILNGKVGFDFEVKPIHRSTFYFRKLALNSSQVNKKLTVGNDFLNPKVDACLSVTCNGNSIFYKVNKNSYNLLGSGPKTFYHCESDTTLRISILDADYGLNFDDRIHDTLICINDLCTKSYKNIPLLYTDKLELYCTTDGRIN